MLNINEIHALRRAASKGDAEAYKTLLAENARLAKRANTRMVALEKAGMAYYAYERAAGYLASEYGSNRFTTSKKKLADPYDLAQNILEERTFLRAETSTIRGQKRVKSARVQAFNDIGIELPQGRENDFLRFLGSDTVRQALNTVGRKTAISNELVEALAGAYDAAAEKKGVKRYIETLLNKLVSGDITYNEVTDYLERKRANGKYLR